MNFIQSQDDMRQKNKNVNLSQSQIDMRQKSNEKLAMIREEPHFKSDQKGLEKEIDLFQKEKENER